MAVVHGRSPRPPEDGASEKEQFNEMLALWGIDPKEYARQYKPKSVARGASDADVDPGAKRCAKRGRRSTD